MDISMLVTDVVDNFEMWMTDSLHCESRQRGKKSAT